MDFFVSRGLNNVGMANEDELPFPLPEIKRWLVSWQDGGLCLWNFGQNNGKNNLTNG